MPKKKNKDGYFRSTFVIGKNPDGNPKRIIIRGKTKKEHDEKLAEAKRLHLRGIDLNDITVNEWGQRWLRIYKANASNEQRKMYSTKLEKFIKPWFGEKPIKIIRASDLQEMMNSFTGKKRGTIVKIRQVIKQMFEAAERDGIIERNPAAYLELPLLEENPRRPLTNIERATIWGVSKTHFCGDYVLVMMLCGLRRGECIALRVEDVDLVRKRIIINKALRFYNNIGKEKSPKSKAGIREVPIPNVLYNILEKRCEGKSPDTLLFTKSEGSPATQQTCKWWWNSFIRQCHITVGAKQYRNKILTETSAFDNNVTPHYLRHTYATDLYASGIDERAQKYFMGHAPLNDVTDIYRKMNDTAFSRAASMIDAYFIKLYSRINEGCAKNVPTINI
jgi:integrase